MNYFIFYNISTFVHYMWNGLWVAPLQGEHWDPKGEVTEQETNLFKQLETNKRRSFELKGKGKFAILQRGTFKTDTDDNT